MLARQIDTQATNRSILSLGIRIPKSVFFRASSREDE